MPVDEVWRALMRHNRRETTRIGKPKVHKDRELRWAMASGLFNVVGRFLTPKSKNRRWVVDTAWVEGFHQAKFDLPAFMLGITMDDPSRVGELIIACGIVL